MEYDVRTRKIASASMWFGVSAVFLYQIFLLPVAATVVGVVALSRPQAARSGGTWMAWLGVSLGALFMLVALVHSIGAWAPSFG